LEGENRMEFKDLLKWRGNTYLNNYIERPNYNSLTIFIDRCVGGTTDDKVDNLTAYASLEIDENLPIIKLEFDSYVANQVTAEHFMPVDDYEIHKGYNFRIITRSKYLDYVRDNTYATFIFPEFELLHYEIACANEIIDIITFKEPVITEIRRNNLI
jgi:hypothetical protein